MSFLSKKLVIILPTFNESRNLRILLDKIYEIDSGISVIIVDDSYDVENKKIKRITQKYNNIVVITRQKKLGRGSAVLMGFAEALKTKHYVYFVEMDTDLAHDPADLPLFLETIRKKRANLVIGSRYLKESHIVNWPFRRLFLSKIINFSLNFWLNLKLHDYTNGYRMYDKKAVEYIIKTGLKEKNFIALSESAYMLKNKGFKIIEIPITFTDRKHGESTVGMRELFMCLVGALRIRLRNIYL